MVDLIILNNNRTYVITYVYVRKSAQVIYSLKQFIESDSSTALDLFNKRKEDPEYKKIKESDRFALINEAGYLSYEAIHINGQKSGITYLDYGVIDIEK